MKDNISFTSVKKILSGILFLLMVIDVFSPSSAMAINTLDTTLPKNIKFTPVATGLEDPLFITHAGDGSGRLFIVQRGGRILILKNGSINPTPFLDISNIVYSENGEQGLLGLAFDPNYETNGRFFVVYTISDYSIKLVRFNVSGVDPDIAISTGTELLSTPPKTHTNHNGGTLAFGSDGYLYMSVGDGGGGDPSNNAQNKNSLYGKILRLDVSGTTYTVPNDNPFTGEPNVREEVWAYGLRNPWRFSFDRSTGDLFLGDVGQGTQEELNFQSSTSLGGENYGWKILEGNLCYEPKTNCTSPADYVPPVFVYDHGVDDSFGCSVTGGYVYRGSNFPELTGVYLYGDFCVGKIWGMVKNASNTWESTLLADTEFRISSFGEDQNGEVYVIDYTGGSVYRIDKAPIVQKTFASSGIYDGVVLESSENSNLGSNANSSAHSLPIGDNSGDRQFRTILSFNTSALPDNAVILSAVLKLKLKETTGTDPFTTHGFFIGDIKNGFFNAVNLEPDDFSGISSRDNVIRFTSSSVNGWINKTMNAIGYQHINELGTTQIRLRFTLDDNDDMGEDTLRVYSGDADDTAARPRLVIKYFIP